MIWRQICLLCDEVFYFFIFLSFLVVQDRTYLLIVKLIRRPRGHLLCERTSRFCHICKKLKYVQRKMKTLLSCCNHRTANMSLYLQSRCSLWYSTFFPPAEKKKKSTGRWIVVPRVWLRSNHRCLTTYLRDKGDIMILLIVILIEDIDDGCTEDAVLIIMTWWKCATNSAWDKLTAAVITETTVLRRQCWLETRLDLQSIELFSSTMLCQSNRPMSYS